MKRDNPAPENNTVFLLRIRYADEKINCPVQLHGGTLGIFTNLKYAENFLRVKDKTRYNFLARKPFKIYEIEEIALNYFWNFIRTRFYNHAGQFYGEHYWEEDSMTFDGRFRRGAVVEFINGSILCVGIVAGVPPDKHSSRFKDYYLVLYGDKEYSCFRAVSHHVFPLSGMIPDVYKKRLTERLQKEPIAKLQEEIVSKSDFTTYRMIE